MSTFSPLQREAFSRRQPEQIDFSRTSRYRLQPVVVDFSILNCHRIPSLTLRVVAGVAVVDRGHVRRETCYFLGYQKG